MFFSSDIPHSDWDPKPAVPGDSQQESLFLPSVYTEILESKTRVISKALEQEYIHETKPPNSISQ